MTRYLISFDDGAMTFPEEDLPDVAEAAHAVVRVEELARRHQHDAGVHVHQRAVQAPRGHVAEEDAPVLRRAIRRDQGGRRFVTTHKDLEEIFGCIRGEFLHPEVFEDQQVDAGQPVRSTQ